MGTGAMIVADGTTSQGELTRPLEKLGSVSVAQRMVDTFRHAGVDRIVRSEEHTSELQSP